MLQQVYFHISVTDSQKDGKMIDIIEKLGRGQYKLQKSVDEISSVIKKMNSGIEKVGKQLCVIAYELNILDEGIFLLFYFSSLFSSLFQSSH